jgi:hypothetical protein
MYDREGGKPGCGSAIIEYSPKEMQKNPPKQKPGPTN